MFFRPINGFIKQNNENLAAVDAYFPRCVLDFINSDFFDTVDADWKKTLESYVCGCVFEVN